MQVFQSELTGQEIEEALKSVKDKVSTSDIVNDYSGGITKIASAESVKLLNDWKTRFGDPEFIRELYLTIPESRVFTAQNLLDLEAVKRRFVGAFKTPSERTTSLISQPLQGSEVSLLIGENGALQQLQFYDSLTASWKTCVWSESPTTQEYAAVGEQTVIRFDGSLYTAAEYGIVISNGSLTSFSKLMIAHNSNEIFYTVNGSVENAPDLLTIESVYYDSADVCLAVFIPPGFTVKVLQTSRI